MSGEQFRKKLRFLLEPLKEARFCLPCLCHYFLSFACIYFYRHGSFSTGHSLFLSQFFLPASLFHFHVFVFLTCVNQNPCCSADWVCLLGVDIISISSQLIRPSFWILRLRSPTPTPLHHHHS